MASPDPRGPKLNSAAGSISMARRFSARCLQAIVRLIAAVPRPLMPVLASLLTIVLRPLARRDVQRLRTNVQHIFGLPAGSHFARIFERQVFYHQIICALETLKATYRMDAVHVSGHEELRAKVAAAEATGKPHLFVTAHLGSWELCAYHCAHSSRRPVHVLAKPPRVTIAHDALEAMRERMGVSVLWTGTKSLLRDMLGALRRVEALGFVMDQKPEGRQGPVVPFFGYPTAFVSGPATMALKFDATVVALFCVREGPFRYRILSETLRVPQQESGKLVDSEQAELELTAKMAAAIEKVIRHYPEQWTWSYKRWRFNEA